MKRNLIVSILLTGLTLTLSARASESSTPVEAHYSVVKAVPEDPYHIQVNIHLQNKTAQNRQGTLQLAIYQPSGILLKDTTFQVELSDHSTEIYPCPVSLPLYGSYRVHYQYHDAHNLCLDDTFDWLTEPVNFFYAFGTPHRMTVAQPDHSSKTLMDVTDSSLTLSWTYEDLNYYPYSSFREIKADWHITLQPQLDGKAFPSSSWSRAKGYLPLMENRYESPEVTLLLEAVGAEEAGIVQITLTNHSDQPHHVRLPWICPGNLKGHNPGWVDETQPTDHLLAGWNAPADQVLILGVGADDYPLDPEMVTQLNMDWQLSPHATRIGYLIRPYDKFARDLTQLRQTDWQHRFEAGQNTWETLLNKAGRICLPDSGVIKAYYAALADIFIMREPVGRGYIATVPGTNGYRSGPNAFESAIATVALAQAGLDQEAEIGYRVNWDLQTDEGDWTEPGGWGHWMWAGTGYKAWAATEYFQQTRDTAFLKKRYPQMLAASRWQHRMRQRTKKSNPDGSRPLTYGLMPQGMGDGGLKNDGSYYGIYYTHNIWPVYADSLAYRAALILGRQEEARELKAIYEEARQDLLRAMRDGAVVNPDGTRWLSAVPGKATSSSCWGLLAPVHTTGLLPADDELMLHTLARAEKQLSPGGLPIHTGWMADGMWVAMALNDFAQVHLMRDESDQAVAYLYATLNHGTPFYSWCEERGQFPGTHQMSGDLQHLWTPIAVARYVRDMLVMEQEDTLHLARGIARGWLASGQPIGVEKMSTHFGDLSYHMHYDTQRSRLVGTLTVPSSATLGEIRLHTLLPKGWKLTHTSSGQLLPDGSGIRFSAPAGIIHFEARVKRR